MSDDYRRDLPSRGEIRHHAGALGSRGGTTISVTMAQALFERWKADEYGWLTARILLIAKKHGEYHADYIATVEMTQRNMIGATVRALVAGGLLASTGEHRVGQTVASHGRRSYVYRLTASGELVVATNRAGMIEMAQQAPPQQEQLFG